MRPLPDGDKRLSAGEIAFTEISGEQCQFPQILGAYEAVYRWVKENEREASGPRARSTCAARALTSSCRSRYR